MGLETATYVNQLVSTNPAASDGLSQGDDHIRLVKGALLSTFPNFTSAQLSATQAMIDAAANPTGKLAAFVYATSDPGWLRCNGGTFAYATHPALGSALGYSSGTCTLPNFEDTGRYVRSVHTGVAVGTYQANGTASHTHGLTVTGTSANESAGHTHNAVGTTANESANHYHTLTNPVSVQSGSSVSVLSASGSGGSSTSNEVVSHNHTFSTTTDQESATHNHTFVGTGTSDATGISETRPESFAAFWYVHV
jgi:hypothetical protein